MRRTMVRDGFTIIEALIALAVIGVAFAALSLSMVTNLRASTTARVATEVKSSANLVLERLLDNVLTTYDVGGDLRYRFTDYYWSCEPSGATGSGPKPSFESVDCAGTVQDVVDQIDVDFDVAAGLGIEGEGFVTITVTATDPNRGQELTIGDRITCYDIYPSPSVTTPRPCPEPLADGGGWR